MFDSTRPIDEQPFRSQNEKRKTKMPNGFFCKNDLNKRSQLNLCPIFISKGADMEMENAIMVLTWVNGIAKPTIIQLC